MIVTKMQFQLVFLLSVSLLCCSDCINSIDFFLKECMGIKPLALEYLKMFLLCPQFSV